jgi:hypothetical protein
MSGRERRCTIEEKFVNVNAEDGTIQSQRAAAEKVEMLAREQQAQSKKAVWRDCAARIAERGRTGEGEERSVAKRGERQKKGEDAGAGTASGVRRLYGESARREQLSRGERRREA